MQEYYENEDTQRGRYLTFALGGEVFGIDIRHITEIVGIQPITELPEAPEYMKGIINLRGKIIPVIDVRLRFKKEPKEYNDRTCIIVIDVIETKVGLIVDDVSDVMMINDENISPAPDFRTGVHNRYLAGIGKAGNNVILLLSCEKLFLDEEIETMKNSGLETIRK